MSKKLVFHNPRKFLAVKQQNDLTLYIYDVITADDLFGGVSAISVAQKLDEAGQIDSITLRVNSPGGSMFEGLAIKNLLESKGLPITTYIDGQAASAASIVALAGKKIFMGQGTVYVIHNAMTLAFGNAGDLRKQADDLEKASAQMRDLYVARTGLGADEIQALMDKETMLDADEAIKLHLADGKSEPAQIAALTTQGPKAQTGQFDQEVPEYHTEKTDVFVLEAEIGSLTI
jgi:ATP-dependent Clp protease protease subunit